MHEHTKVAQEILDAVYGVVMAKDNVCAGEMTQALVHLVGNVLVRFYPPEQWPDTARKFSVLAVEAARKMQEYEKERRKVQ